MVSSLLLASNSPRRRELLAEARFDFENVFPRAEEKADVDLTARELTLCNAIRKGLWVARQHPDKVVLAADTLVALEGSIIGKPKDLADAAQILRRLSGRVHEVWSAVFICHLAAARSTSFHEISRVRFRPLDQLKIDNYLRRINPLDKAGAYAAQGHGSEIIEQIDGSYTNVVGLPMETTTAALARFGIKPKSSNASRPIWPAD
jgi:septum formation protein